MQDAKVSEGFRGFTHNLSVFIRSGAGSCSYQYCFIIKKSYGVINDAIMMYYHLVYFTFPSPQSFFLCRLC